MQKPIKSKGTSQKIPDIEGIRALAITMVLAFHFFARWTPPIYPQNTYPYKLETARQVSQYGYMGVQLFFMVSGFVILCSLENQFSFATFARARIRRIYPSLFIAIPLIYIVCNLLNQRFIAPIPIHSLLPSLTLLGPDFINHLFATNFTWTTGVLWSLFIEIQFYLVSGALFFNLKKFTFLTKLFVFAFTIQLLKIILVVSNSNVNSTFDALLPINKYIWWFVAGSTFWRITSSHHSRRLYGLIMISIFFNLISLNFESSEFRFSPIPTIITLLSFALFYLIAQKSKKVHFLRSHVLVWFGGLSYEFYLIHESIGVSMISKMGEFTMFRTSLPAYLFLLIMVITLLIALSTLLKSLSGWSLKMIRDIFASYKCSRLKTGNIRGDD